MGCGGKKYTKTYYFSVEGETEKLYLSWLQRVINAEENSKNKVKFDVKIEKNPLSRVKSLNVLGKTEVTHIIDCESQSDEHKQSFKNSLDRMRSAEKLGKNIKYQLGYSNYTFELWIILHKIDCNSKLSDRSHYLTHINAAYGQDFICLKDYKKEENFENCILNNLTLEDVRQAVKRSSLIMQNNRNSGCSFKTYNGYEYCEENPSLSIWEVIEKILKENELI